MPVPTFQRFCIRFYDNYVVPVAVSHDMMEDGSDGRLLLVERKVAPKNRGSLERKRLLRRTVEACAKAA